MQDQATAITMTAACELGTHRCAGVILSLTDVHGQLCGCGCHQDPILDHDELEAIAEAEADRRLDQDLEDELFGAEL
jgi:hypothetical protein